MDKLKGGLTNRRGNEKENLESLDCLLDYCNRYYDRFGQPLDYFCCLQLSVPNSRSYL